MAIQAKRRVGVAHDQERHVGVVVNIVAARAPYVVATSEQPGIKRGSVDLGTGCGDVEANRMIVAHVCREVSICVQGQTGWGVGLAIRNVGDDKRRQRG